MMKTALLLLGVLVCVSSQMVLKEKVDEFFYALNQYSAQPDSTSCKQVLKFLDEEGTQVTVSGTTYEPEELEFLFCDYIPKVLNVDDLNVEVTNVEESKGNVVGTMTLDGTWLQTNNKFKDVELFWRLTSMKDKIKVFDLIPVNPSDFTEATMTSAACGASQIWQAFATGEPVDDYMDEDVTLNAPNLYATKSLLEERQTTWSKGEYEDFIAATFGLFNFTDTSIKEYHIIDSDDTSLLVVATFNNLTTAKGKTPAEDIQFWMHFEFNDTEAEDDEDSKNQTSSQTSSPCDNPPLLTKFRLLLSRPLKLADVVDFGSLLNVDDGEEEEDQTKGNGRSRSGLTEDGKEEGQDKEEDSKNATKNPLDAVKSIFPENGDKDKDKSDKDKDKSDEDKEKSDKADTDKDKKEKDEKDDSKNSKDDSKNSKDDSKNSKDDAKNSKEAAKNPKDAAKAGGGDTRENR